MIQREEYLKMLIEWREKRVIKVVTGVRRCGKSTLFALFIEHLTASGVSPEQIISVNLESLENEHLLDYKALHQYIVSKLVKGRYTYVFIDEAQRCASFEKAVDSLYIKDNVDVYITGSNADLLSGELATLLSGRYVEISMLPFSFSEYLRATGGGDVNAAFNDYLKYGSFPYVADLSAGQSDNAGIIMQYIEGIYNTILIKDVAAREGISDIALLESIIRFLCDNIGSPVSSSKICNVINSSGRKISVNTIDNYLRALSRSYIFYKADRYDIKGKQYLKTLGKYYIVDTGLRSILLSGVMKDLGHVLENIVYFELLRRGNKVHIGKLGDKEVDFVAVNPQTVEYYQVSASVLDSGTLARELDPLRDIRDNHPKYILTLDVIGAGTSHDGILQLNLIDWLASGRI